MTALIIDTTSADIRLAMPDASAVIPTEKQSLDLPGAVENFLTENGAAFRDLSAVGVVVGPGSFTGIRLGIAYARGLSIGLNIPVIPLTLFDIFLEQDPGAFVAIDSNKNDFFVSTADLPPQIMSIDDVESAQMKYAKTVGHKPCDLSYAFAIVARKLNDKLPVIPLYIRPHYAEVNN